MVGKKNAILRRIDILRDRWNEFAEMEDGRVLRWVVSDDEVRMVDCFITMEMEDGAGETPDLFLQFDEQFVDLKSYGLTLQESFIRQYEEQKEEMEKAEISTDWVPPTVYKDDNDILTFLNCCSSFQEHYQDIVENLAIYLIPKEINDTEDWLKWIEAVAQYTSPNVRFVVLDWSHTPNLEPLVKREPKGIVTMTPELDMGGALEELSEEGGNLDKPGGQYRHLFVKLNKAASTGDYEMAETIGDKAIQIAQKAQWQYLVAAVHLALGSSFINGKKVDDAVIRYQQADNVGSEIEQSGEPIGTRLRLQAGMGVGTALFSSEKYKDAAEAYEKTTPLAEKLEDKNMQLECWRMASYCYEIEKDHKLSWDCGMKALDLGETMKPEDREHSTLPYVGEGLMRLTKINEFADQEQSVEDKMVELVGPDWRPDH